MVWYAKFLKTLKTKPMHVKQLAVYVVEDVNDHFMDFCQFKDKQSIYNDDIFNFNELGFPISITTNEQVIVLIDCIVVY